MIADFVYAWNIFMNVGCVLLLLIGVMVVQLFPVVWIIKKHSGDVYRYAEPFIIALFMFALLVNGFSIWSIFNHSDHPTAASMVLGMLIWSGCGIAWMASKLSSKSTEE